ncbi:hypothetical protein OQA88_6540 [Cercophora sp. LCS_1]
MKPTQCVFNPTAALRRVFIHNPLLTTQPSGQIILPRILLPSVVAPRLQQQQQHAFSTQTVLRNKYSSAKQDKDVSDRGSAGLRDRAIQNEYPLVHLRDEVTGKLSEPIAPSEILRGLSKRENSLVVIALPSEKGPQYPICRIIDLKKEREQQAALKAKQKLQERQRNADKELEINWAIAQNDLNMKFNQLKKFLDKGFVVQLTLLKKTKRGKRDASADEIKALLSRVEQELQDIPGTKEIKRTGAVGKNLTIIVQGTKGAVTAAESTPASAPLPAGADATGSSSEGV